MKEFTDSPILMTMVLIMFIIIVMITMITLITTFKNAKSRKKFLYSDKPKHIGSFYSRHNYNIYVDSNSIRNIDIMIKEDIKGNYYLYPKIDDVIYNPMLLEKEEL